MEPLPRGANFQRALMLWEIGLHIAGNPNTPYYGPRDMCIAVGSGSNETFKPWLRMSTGSPILAHARLPQRAGSRDDQSIRTAHASLSRHRNISRDIAGAHRRRLSVPRSFRLRDSSAHRAQIAGRDQGEKVSAALIDPRGCDPFDPRAGRSNSRRLRHDAERHRVLGRQLAAERRPRRRAAHESDPRRHHRRDLRRRACRSGSNAALASGMQPSRSKITRSSIWSTTSAGADTRSSPAASRVSRQTTRASTTAAGRSTPARHCPTTTPIKSATPSPRAKTKCSGKIPTPASASSAKTPTPRRATFRSIPARRNGTASTGSRCRNSQFVRTNR